MRKPRTRELLHDYEREDKDLTARGEIISINTETDECVVQFVKREFFLSSTCVLAYAGDRFWDARGEKVWNYVGVRPEYVNEYGEPRFDVYECNSYTFDDLDYESGVWAFG